MTVPRGVGRLLLFRYFNNSKDNNGNEIQEHKRFLYCHVVTSFSGGYAVPLLSKPIITWKSEIFNDILPSFPVSIDISKYPVNIIDKGAAASSQPK